ncbi:putative GTD-binding domain, protein FLOURY 1 [Helianthus annuus]|nr:putative GTD-binding domain, protein FLOURY 1 [Helianthus annuus]
MSVSNSWGLEVLMYGCFKKFIDLLSLLILFYFSLKYLHFNVFNLGVLNWFCSRNCKCGLINFMNFSNPPMIDQWKEVKETVNCRKTSGFDDQDDGNQECYDEDEVFDVMSLRKLVKMERQRANDTYLELEKERMAATTAAEAAMEMILRLQNEKSAVELEAQRHQRLSHEKQLHDQEVIQSLRWIVMKHESERSLLEDRLRVCKQRLMLCMNDDGDDDGCELSLSYLDERLVSSLDLGLSPW